MQGRDYSGVGIELHLWRYDWSDKAQTHPMNITEMTDEEKRVQIAEAWGFEPGTINTGTWLGYCDARHAETLYQLGCDAPDSDEKPDHVLAKVPYFLGDLNAMAEAEKCLPTWEAREQYTIKLNVLTQGFDHPLYTLATATARQRADAFLLTL